MIFDKNNNIIYKGFKTGITREQMYNLQDNGIDVQNYLEEIYKLNLSYIRDKKIDLILSK